jgi:hypothetical protein
LYPNYSAFDAENRHRADAAVVALKSWQDASIAQVRQELSAGRVVALDTASHYMFLTNEAEVLGLINGFLADVVR